MTPHSTTPDTNDGLDRVLIDLVTKTAKRTSGEFQPMDISFVEMDEAKAAINQFMLDTFMELISQTTSNWGNGKDLCDPDELRKAAQEKFQ